jgi:MoxR-like ATPase
MNSESSLVATKRRIAGQLVGRDHELELVLAAVDAGRDIVLEGPPGTSKTTMLKAITAEWSIPLLFVEGNADLTPAKLVGHHNPARVLREDYSTANFVPGPLVDAMESGGFLYIEEFNRAPEDTLNTLLTAMADRKITVPRVGTITARPSFRVIASMNPLDDIGTTRLSTSVHSPRVPDLTAAPPPAGGGTAAAVSGPCSRGAGAHAALNAFHPALTCRASPVT